MPVFKLKFCTEKYLSREPASWSSHSVLVFPVVFSSTKPNTKEQEILSPESPCLSRDSQRQTKPGQELPMSWGNMADVELRLNWQGHSFPPLNMFHFDSFPSHFPVSDPGLSMPYFSFLVASSCLIQAPHSNSTSVYIWYMCELQKVPNMIPAF